MRVSIITLREKDICQKTVSNYKKTKAFQKTYISCSYLYFQDDRLLLSRFCTFNNYYKSAENIKIGLKI